VVNDLYYFCPGDIGYLKVPDASVAQARKTNTMNKNTRRNRKADRKAGKYFHGTECFTDFRDRAKNPQNRRRSARRYNMGGSYELYDLGVKTSR
jgi:DNA invertase Pin-like site-specific DNA recombinase